MLLMIFIFDNPGKYAYTFHLRGSSYFKVNKRNMAGEKLTVRSFGFVTLKKEKKSCIDSGINAMSELLYFYC